MIVDTGILVAAADEADPDHHACAELLEAAASALRASPLVVAEAAYLIGRQLGPAAEARFFRSIADGEIRLEALTGADLARMAELVETYVDMPLGGTDASVVAIARAPRPDDDRGRSIADTSPSSAPLTPPASNSCRNAGPRRWVLERARRQPLVAR